MALEAKAFAIEMNTLALETYSLNCAFKLASATGTHTHRLPKRINFEMIAIEKLQLTS